MHHGSTQGWLLGWGIALIGISTAHSLEDFVNGIPARFGLSVIAAALLLGAAYAVQSAALALAAQGRRAGTILTGLFGAGWAVAAAADHWHDILFANHYRAGVLSKGLEVAIIVVGAAQAITAARLLQKAGK
jgi:hypothetical protein